MNSHRALTRRCRGTAAISVLVLAWMVGSGSIASAQSAAISPAPTGASSAAAAQDIHEIRGPKPIPSPWLIPVAALAAILAAGVAWAGWVWVRRPKSLLQTPVEIALARLEYARGLMRPELGREFSIEASIIVRQYIESRFRVMAAHLTTPEFLSDSLSSKDPVLAAHRPLLAEFLQSCDMAKFGGWNLSPQTMEEMFRKARTFVVESAAPVGTAKPPSINAQEVYDSVPSA